jgi:quercetin dioxygenase-like cupin family protein
MRRARIALPVALALAGPAAAEGLEIQRSGARASARAPAEHFTGQVRLDSPFQAAAPARVGGATVTFEPGARTDWHTHPLGQTLIVTAGRGWVQREGSAAQEIRPGDIVWIPPNTRHWHGATATTAMSHIAIAERQDGSPVTWMEKVGDDQYPR